MAPKSLAQRVAAMAAPKSTTAASTPNTSVLTDAFVTITGPKRSQNVDTEIAKPSKIYPLSFADRKKLATGPKVQLFDADNKFVADITLALFRATSTKKNDDQLLVQNRTVIKLPTGLDVEMVKDLVQHLKDVCTWKKYAKDIRSYESTYEDVQLCSAAEYLGMNIYTQHIFNWYWARMSAGDLPGYGDVDAFSAVKTPLGDKILGKAAQSLAKLDFEDQIPDAEEFKAYLITNNRFLVAITQEKTKLLRQKAWEERKLKREEAALLQKAIDEDHRGKVHNEKAKQKAKWDAKKKEDSNLAARVKAKLAKPGKKTWKADEAIYLERVYGKKVPVKG